jgi:hypothetical protein
MPLLLLLLQAVQAVQPLLLLPRTVVLACTM